MISLPYHAESEQALLGCLISGHYSAELWVDLNTLLNEEDFYLNPHRIIFSAIDELDKKASKIDAVTVAEHLTQKQKITQIGGVSYLKELMDQVISVSHIMSYAQIIKEKSKLRKIILFSQKVIEDAKSQSFENFDEFMGMIEKKIYDLHSTNPEQGLYPIESLISDTINHLESLSVRDESIIGVPTGFVELDEITSGLHPGEMTILAARPSMGKTALAINLARHACLREKKKVAFFSLEMSKETVMIRFLSLLAKIPLSFLRSGQLNKNQWSSLMKSIGKLEKCPLFINDVSGLDPYHLRTQCRHMKMKHGLDLIIVDYLQMMSLKSRSESREREVSEISKALKSLAKELKVPVLALAQLNRSVEARSDKKPLLSDLRESGSIEQDSDVIMLMYRESYYNKEFSDSNLTEIIIGKQRNGPTGSVKLQWNPQYGLFEDYSENIDPKPPLPDPPNFYSSDAIKDSSPEY